MNTNRIDIQRAFDQAAIGDFDALRKQLVPGFDDMYGAVLQILPWPRDARIRVLDIGAGTGLLSGMVQAAWPNAQLTLVDISPEMLARARERFSAMEQDVEIVVGDITGALPGGPFDAVISALAIHHLSDSEKHALYRRLFDRLQPDGWFVNADQVRGPTADMHHLYETHWLDRVRTAGVPEDELTAARARMTFDQEATLADQLGWLTEAGFTDVDCLYKKFRMATFAGRRPL